MARISLTRACATALACALGVGLLNPAMLTARPDDPRTLGGQLKLHASAHYEVYTDLTGDDVREAVLRMNVMSEEYHERTKNLFQGRIAKKLPFYLYARAEDYVRAGGMPKTAGVFVGDALLAFLMRDAAGGVSDETWHTTQHEGFHQYVHAVIRGDIPIWTNEGLAEYFGESLFTGDGLVTGNVAPTRLARVQARINAKDFKSVRDMMRVSHEQWNAAINNGGEAGSNYDMAWAMVHFLVHADGGKYEPLFVKFLVMVGKGRTWEQAWSAAFGDGDGFEQAWRDYWLKMPRDGTATLRAQAVVATLTSFLARAWSQRDSIDTLDALLALDGAAIKHAPDDWLPPRLFDAAKARAQELRARGCTLALQRKKSGLPTLELVMPDKTTLTGVFTLKSGRVDRVRVDVTPPPKVAAPAPKPGPTK